MDASGGEFTVRWFMRFSAGGDLLAFCHSEKSLPNGLKSH